MGIWTLCEGAGPRKQGHQGRLGAIMGPMRDDEAFLGLLHGITSSAWESLALLGESLALLGVALCLGWLMEYTHCIPIALCKLQGATNTAGELKKR